MSKNLNDILDEWEKDNLPFDESDPAQVQARVIKLGSLHAKYTRYYAEHKDALRQEEVLLAKTRKIKWLYYNGKLSEEELKKYGLEPFQFVLKSDINIYMDSDKDVSTQKKVVEYHNLVADTCEKIIKDINNRTYQLNTLIKYIMWTNGAGIS